MSKDYGVKLCVCYGDALFKELEMENEWLEILKFLKLWKKDIPDLPEINFDLDAESSFEEIKTTSPATFRKLLSNDEIYNEILLTVFPEKKTLKLLLTHFKELSGNKIYHTLYNALNNKLGNQNVGLFG